MFRLSAYSPNAKSAGLWRDVGRRVRSAEISTADDLARGLKSIEDCQGVVIERSSAQRPVSVERLLQAGHHVLLIDLPPWQSGELVSLTQLAEQKGVQFKVVNSARYQPSRRLIKQQIASHLGPPGLLRSYRWEPAAADLPTPIAGLPAGLIDDLDLALWLFGEPAERVYAVEHKLRDPSQPAGRYLQIHLGFALGMALIDYTNRLPTDKPYQSMSVIGFSGAAYAEDDQNMQLVFRGGRAEALPTVGSPVLALTALVQEFVDELAAGRTSAASTNPWSVYSLADAINRSLTSHQAIACEGC
jgi:predicted dehydrogenase